ncbi:MAG: hypothetical protein R3C56_28465 [Pirellulaceae bacterium]
MAANSILSDAQLVVNNAPFVLGPSESLLGTVTLPHTPDIDSCRYYQPQPAAAAWGRNATFGN